MSSRKFLLFIKVGDEIHMNKLLMEGEVFCKTLNYFSNVEEKSLRYDSYEGINQIEQIRNIEVFTEDGETLLGTGKTGQLHFRGSNTAGNVFCMYGVETDSLKLESGIIKPFMHDLSNIAFGQFAVLILKPAEFISRVKQKANKMGLSFEFSPVTYYDPETHHGNLSPFHKPKSYSNQSEVRFWISNHLVQDIVINIGDMSDIAKLLPFSDISKLGFCPEYLPPLLAQVCKQPIN